ncbi:MAG: carboxylesterase family protein [Deltaproteobacteria bacterium]|nr:carboxylesterase family protein [Deltaproteobacteria bacterium]
MLEGSRRGLILITGLWLCAAGCGSDEAPPAADPSSRRQIGQGEIVGFTKEGAHAWLGIPFAAPPVAELRWQPPRPPLPWKGAREALADGPICPQLDFSNEPTGDEDCLLLSVYAPRLRPEEVPEGDDRLPVLVYIHGGGMSIGSSQLFVGSRLAQDNRVVVVTIQYRLGILGWLSHPALQRGAKTPEERSGNWGTLDVVRALEWIRDDIAAFGGDPERVTIFGQSAGGIQVYSMLLSPRAKGLFHGAISQSGFATTFSRAQAESLPDEARKGEGPSSAEFLLMLLQRDGAAADRQGAKRVAAEMSPDEISDYLHGKSAEELLGVFADSGGLAGIYVSPFAIRDGYVLPEDLPEQLLARGDYNRVPVILGTNFEEHKGFMTITSPHVMRIGPVPLRIRDPERYDRVSRYGALLWKALGADEPASAMRKNQDSVWVYRFDWADEPATFWMDFSRLFGAAHGVELPFVFGSPEWSYLPSFLFDGVESFEPLSRQMRSYWAQFAARGDPGRGQSGDLREWERWSPVEGSAEFLVFDSSEKGGSRMSSDTVTRATVLERVRQDPEIQGAEERCEIYQTFVQWSDTFSPEEYTKLEDGICQDYPLLGRTVFD